MNEEERQRQFDFILSQQAQFAADIQKLQESQSKMVEAQTETIQIVNRLAAVTVEGFKQTNAKIDALIDAQTRTEERLDKVVEAQAHTDQRLDVLINTQIRTEEALTKLAKAQTHTEHRLDALIDIVREGRNGKS